jgi:hypothetical protein
LDILICFDERKVEAQNGLISQNGMQEGNMDSTQRDANLLTACDM